VALSSLAFSAGEQVPTSVDLSLGGASVGSASVDPAVVSTTDEIGRASITFTVPEGAAGDQLVATPNVGAAITLPFTVAEGEPEPGPFEGTISTGASKVSAGGTLKVSGSTFTPGETVTIELRPKKGEALPAGEVKVGEDGSFSTTITVPKKAQPGPYTVAVTQADGDEATASVHVNRAGGIGKIIQDLLDWIWDLITGR